MRRSKVFLYPLSSRVAFPYHEYQVTLASNQFEGKHILNLAKDYDNLIGFITKVDSSNSAIEKIDGFGKYGTLMKIYK